VLVGVARTSLAADFLGLIALLGALVSVWFREGRGGGARIGSAGLSDERFAPLGFPVMMVPCN